MIATVIAAAQSISVPGDTEANVQEHLRFITAAHAAGVQMLVFPELSLTGYELPLMQRCLLHPDDDVLAPIRALVRQTDMVVTVGAPVAPADASTHTLPAIGAITFRPDGSAVVYRKHHVHSSEANFASPGPQATSVISLGLETVGQAICADIGQPTHAALAAQAGATLYLAGVLVSEAGYAKDSAALQQYAQIHGMGTLMANHGGPSGDYISAGKSAFWAPGGDLVVAAPGAGAWLVIASMHNTTAPIQWTGEAIRL
ncbi:MAG: carbon-nitrogen hydrolase family protein [Rhodoferax sp.]|nr:carbon-nitrogen hydrolase family protein [Rhodoferax sp.]MDP3652792.1 carbon-nitrogen hydrolase family protein [Rhodoferax sp.]